MPNETLLLIEARPSCSALRRLAHRIGIFKLISDSFEITVVPWVTHFFL